MKSSSKSLLTAASKGSSGCGGALRIRGGAITAAAEAGRTLGFAMFEVVVAELTREGARVVVVVVVVVVVLLSGRLIVVVWDVMVLERATVGGFVAVRAAARALAAGPAGVAIEVAGRTGACFEVGLTTAGLVIVLLV